MDLKTYTTGIQHIGIPTNDIDKTVEFYHKLGFETAFETVNEEANEKVVFLKLGTLVVETYENHAAKMEHGAIDHVALDVRDIEEIFRYINEAGLNSTQDIIHFLYPLGCLINPFPACDKNISIIIVGVFGRINFLALVSNSPVLDIHYIHRWFIKFHTLPGLVFLTDFFTLIFATRST